MMMMMIMMMMMVMLTMINIIIIFFKQYVFLHLTTMYSCTFGLFVLYWYECPLVVLAYDSLHVCTVCIWNCDHARFYVEAYIRHS